MVFLGYQCVFAKHNLTLTLLSSMLEIAIFRNLKCKNDNCFVDVQYGKDFNDIRQDFLPWKTLKNIIEYYYMWKTTDRYVQQKRVKAADAESKLKQVYIPN